MQTGAKADGGTNISARIERTFRASPAKVFRAWTQAEILKQWICPGDHIHVVDCTVDARVGGSYRIHMRDASGADHIVNGTYDEVVPNKKLVFSWAWITTPEKRSRVTVELSPAQGNGCHLILVHDRFHDDGAREGHVRHWIAAFSTFDAKLAAVAD